MSQITTHVLDTSNGMPAQGIRITLQFLDGSGYWQNIAEGVTNEDGRISDLLDDNSQIGKGVYRLIFETGSYFNEMDTGTFYPYVPVVFEIADDGHYHVPLLLNPYGYSTYRGS